MDNETFSWDDMKGSSFISSMASTISVTIPGHDAPMGRYAVWVPGKKDPEKHYIMEVNNNLEYLINKYGVDESNVFALEGGSE